MPGRHPFGRPLPLCVDGRGVCADGVCVGIRSLSTFGSEYSRVLLGEGSKTTESLPGVPVVPGAVPDFDCDNVSLVAAGVDNFPGKAVSLGGVFSCEAWLVVG